MNPTEIVARAVEIEKTRGVDAALDTVYLAIDDLCTAGKFTSVEGVLHQVNESLSTDLILGILTTTMSARRHLPSRPQIVERARQLFVVRGEDDVEGLMRGL